VELDEDGLEREKPIDDSKLWLQGYEIEKGQIKSAFKNLLSSYIEEYKLNSVGKKVKGHHGSVYLISNISIWDTLDRKQTKLLIEYYGRKVSKTGTISDEQRHFFPDKRYAVVLPSWFKNKDYLEEKKQLLKQYTKLKANFSRENKLYKKGEEVVNYSGEHFIIESISFRDSLTWEGEAFYSYRGRMIQKRGKLSYKLYNLYSISKFPPLLVLSPASTKLTQQQTSQ
jgi:hypothetical protein